MEEFAASTQEVSRPRFSTVQYVYVCLIICHFFLHRSGLRKIYELGLRINRGSAASKKKIQLK